jgi:isopenicillin-N epimerase
MFQKLSGGRAMSVKSVLAGQQMRDQMLLDPTVINLNTGSFGPLSRPVFDAVTALRQRLAAEPMDFFVRQAPPLLAQARARLASFLHADARRLIFTVNTTSAINTVAAGLMLASPGEILMTDHEYGAMQWAWERAARRQGLTVRTLPLPRLPNDPGEIVAAAAQAMTPRTRLLFFSHVLSPTGMVLPARELCELARRRGILSVIDGAHAPAMIPLDLTEIDADFYAGNGHKWLLAPTGSGFLYLGRESAGRLLPLQVSWGWHFDPARADEPDEFGSTPRIRAFEFEGTRDLCPWLAVPAAIEFQEAFGWTAIRSRMAELAGYARLRLGENETLRLATPKSPLMHGSITAFELPPGTDPAQMRKELWEGYRIEAPVIERPDRLLIRASTHFYNTYEEIDWLAEALNR